MFFGIGIHEIRKAALLRAIRFCGNEETLAALIEVDRTTLNKWVNIPDREIPYNKALLIEKHTGVSIEHLIPDKIEENEYLKDKANTSKFIFRHILKKEIIIKDSLALPCPRPGRPIIIGTDLMLLSGSVELQEYAETARIEVVVVDVEHLLWQILSPTIQLKQANINSNFFYSERVAIGLYLEKRLGKHQGQRNDLKIIKNSQSLCPEMDKVIERTDTKIARIIGLGSKSTYHSAKQVCLRGISELINAMDYKKISIAKAAEIAKLPKAQQLSRLQQYLRESLKQK